MKTCSRCNMTKPTSDFSRQSSKKDGRYTFCKECVADQFSKDYKERPSHYLWKRAKRRAQKNNIEFSIDERDISIPDVCPILGIPLSASTSLWSNNSPSLDRIDNSKGYARGNIAVISFLANSFKSDYDLEEMERIATRMENLINYMKSGGRDECSVH